MHKTSLLSIVFILLCAFQTPGNAAQGTFRVTLLGTIGGTRVDPDRYGASLLVEAGDETLLFDCGRGAALRLLQSGHSLPDVDKVFLSHLHLDHILSVPDLWLAMGGHPLRVWGPEGTAAMTAGLELAYWASNHFSLLGPDPAPVPPIVATDIDEGVVYERNGVKVTAFLVDHRWVKPAMGYRVDYAGHSVLYSGDTSFSENLIAHASGLDVLIHEVYMYAEPEHCADIPTCDYHSTPEMAAEVFRRTQPKLAVYTHQVWLNTSRELLLFRTKRIYDGPLQIGEDLMVIDIGDQVKVHSNGPPRAGASREPPAPR